MWWSGSSWSLYLYMTVINHTFSNSFTQLSNPFPEWYVTLLSHMASIVCDQKWARTLSDGLSFCSNCDIGRSKWPEGLRYIEWHQKWHCALECQSYTYLICCAFGVLESEFHSVSLRCNPFSSYCPILIQVPRLWLWRVAWGQQIGICRSKVLNFFPRRVRC